MAPSAERLELPNGAIVRGQQDAYIVDQTGPPPKGANGIVYHAARRKGGEIVALKLFSPRDAVTEEKFELLRKNFKNEVLKTRRLAHWGIVQILDWGTTKIRRHIVPFTVMEYAPRSLRDVLRDRDRPLGLFAKMLYSAILCETVDYINSQGQIHRDIKPENILFDQAGVIKVADLGIAVFVPGFELSALKSSGLYSEPADYHKPRHHFSPEQLALAEGRSDTDLRRSDIFQLGKVLHEIFTGRNPVGQIDRTDRAYGEIAASVLHIIEGMLSEVPDKRPSLEVCCAVIYRELEMYLREVYAVARKMSRTERQSIVDSFETADVSDPGMKGHVPGEVVRPLLGRSVIRIVRSPSEEGGIYHRVGLTDRGRDVREILSDQGAFHEVLKLYKLLERTPRQSDLATGRGMYPWMPRSARRGVPDEAIAFCQRKTGSWSALALSAPFRLGSRWWLEIHESELPMPGNRKVGAEYLLRYAAPWRVVSGESLRSVLGRSRSALLRAGISRSVVSETVRKRSGFTARQPLVLRRYELTSLRLADHWFGLGGGRFRVTVAKGNGKVVRVEVKRLASELRASKGMASFSQWLVEKRVKLVSSQLHRALEEGCAFEIAIKKGCLPLFFEMVLAGRPRWVFEVIGGHATSECKVVLLEGPGLLMPLAEFLVRTTP